MSLSEAVNYTVEKEQGCIDSKVSFDADKFRQQNLFLSLAYISLLKKATTDPLTGLQYTPREEGKGDAYAVIDLRKLHGANRKYGHKIVDEYGFAPFGRYMAENFREKDRVTRTPGKSDEFRVTAHGCTHEELDAKLANLQREYASDKIGIVAWDYAAGRTVEDAEQKLVYVKAKRNPLKYIYLAAKNSLDALMHSTNAADQLPRIGYSAKEC
jgi:GGDEF domain-containing protein